MNAVYFPGIPLTTIIMTRVIYKSNADWATSPDARKERFKSFLINHEYDLNVYLIRLNRMMDDLNLLAHSLNDSPEEYRKEALRQLREPRRDIYDEVIRIITSISIHRDNWDAKYFFPCVATNEYIAQLPDTAKRCMNCNGDFEEGSEMVWKPCGKHVSCLKCWERLATGNERLPLPFNAICCCAGLPEMF
jgi:hypothetical protein